MKFKLILALLLSFSLQIFSQEIQFVDATYNEPLANVIVFSNSGDVLATSDIEGKIQRQQLLPAQDKYVLVFEGFQLGQFTAKDLNQDRIKLKVRFNKIEEVVILKEKPAKYMFIKGSFNVYMLVNKQLNVYADGVITYVFDNKTKRLKDKKIEQYRVFLKSNANEDRKNIGSLVYDDFLEEPNLKKALNRLEKSNSEKQKEIKTKDLTKIQYSANALENKPFKIFGYQFFDLDYLHTLNFAGDSKNIKYLKEYSEIYNFKLKHKSEPNFHQLTQHSNFIPTEISFGNKDNLPNKKLDTEKSSYTFEYWKTNGFPNMQPVFGSFFKDSLKEKPNKK